jgi:hypothetical protein
MSAPARSFCSWMALTRHLSISVTPYSITTAPAQSAAQKLDTARARAALDAEPRQLHARGASFRSAYRAERVDPAITAGNASVCA